MNRALHGSCHVPVAAFAQLHEGRLHLQGLVGSVAEGRVLRAQGEALDDAPEALGGQVAEALLQSGAGAMLPGPD